MSRELYQIDLKVTLESPYLVHGNDPGRFGLDATLLTDHRGRPILPGSLVAGRIAETWVSCGKQLGNADANHWFGVGGVNGTQQAGQRSRIATDDLRLSAINGNPVPTSIGIYDLSRIRQDDETGAAAQGALLIIEQLAAPGAKLRFEGVWYVWATADEMILLVPQLRAALILQTQFGAYRNIGFGRLLEVSVEAKLLVSTPLSLRTDVVRQRFALITSGTLCIGSRSRRGNVFESDEVVSGGTILATIAQMLLARHDKSKMQAVGTALSKHFDQLRCTYALPAKVHNKRPIPLPQSLVFVGDEIKDASRYACPPAELSQTPAFQTDWKDKEYTAASKHQGWGDTLRHLRVRTDIDGEGKAKESALFAYECVYAPIDEQGDPQTEWLFDFDLSGVPETERSAIWTELAELLGYGLFPIGKTDARVQVSIRETGNVWESALDDLADGDFVSVLLVSDALLFPTVAIADKGEVDLSEVYRSAFGELPDSDNSLDYSHHFATQRLVGGEYMNRRYLRQKNKPYQPWVLTEAGSVFVFKVKDAERAGKLLKRWSEQGLGLPQKVKTECGNTWQEHSFLPQNGYGEVAISPNHGFAPL